ncbi:hypothetical protein D3C86_2128230 [compost metagenome]
MPSEKNIEWLLNAPSAEGCGEAAGVVIGPAILPMNTAAGSRLPLPSSLKLPARLGVSDDVQTLELVHSCAL